MKHVIVKTPCCGGNANIEILKPGDQVCVCPLCKKKFLLVWSKIGKHKVIYGKDR